MGIYSKHFRYRESGESANVNNVNEFGMPKRSLFTSTKLMSFHHQIDVTDEYENVVYRSKSKAFSFHDKTDIVDASGNHVAHMEQKLFSFHDIHYVTMADGTRFELSNELFHMVKDIFNIKGLDWRLEGNIWGLNFRLFDRDGSIIAVISQKFMSLHDKYCIDVYKTEYEAIVVAILIILQHIIRDRENNSSN